MTDTEAIAEITRLAEDGIHAAEISRRTGLPEWRIGRLKKIADINIPSANITWTPEKKEELRRMVESGARIADVARTIGMSVNGVHGACIRYDIKMPHAFKNRAKPPQPHAIDGSAQWTHEQMKKMDQRATLALLRHHPEKACRALRKALECR